ncbi:MAG: isochorismatase [Bacteroides sp. SM23_62_1]|nr:MAG: isochorismatase [Bacteroides sp. SM23_62_1]
MRIIKEHTAGLIIDIQEKLVPHIHRYESVTARTALLIQGLKILDIPLIITQQYTKGLGETIPFISEAVGNYLPVEKVAFSCCDEPGFMKKISQLGRKNIVIAGIEAHVCVLQTVIDLLDNAFMPVVVEDCISSRKNRDKKTAVGRMKQEGAIITTYESILFELTRFAGTDVFKQISRLVK